jgi:hypothetical protein
MDNVTHLGLDVQSLGIRCDVFVPALIPRRAGQRDKTDRLDARNLSRLHPAGALTPIRVDVSIAAKNLRAAREAVEALERVASETSATLLEATAATARASFDLAEGQVDQTPAEGAAFVVAVAATEVAVLWGFRDVRALDVELEPTPALPQVAGWQERKDAAALRPPALRDALFPACRSRGAAAYPNDALTIARVVARSGKSLTLVSQTYLNRLGSARRVSNNQLWPRTVHASLEEESA